MARKKNDLLLYGGAAVGIAVLAGVAYIFRDAFSQGAPQISLNVTPSEVQQGAFSQPVTASGNIIVNGQPSSQPVYMRVREPNGTYTGTVSKFGPSFSEVITTSNKPAGDYVVEVSDRLDFF